MPARETTGRADVRAFYQDFSLAVGLRDWLAANPRHEQLKLKLAEVLERRRGLRILDVGCGAGVMSQYLCRHGTVTGVDYSEPAIRLARTLVPEAGFYVGSLEDVPSGPRYDLITMFDVLEHIPTPERPSFLAELYDRLAPEGLIFASTPYPNFTRHRRAIGDEGLQVVDEEIELPQLLTEAECLGLQLIRFEAYDVFAGTPEYQIMVFTPERAPGGDARLRSAQLDQEMRVISRRGGRWLRRARYAARMLRSGERAAARWFLTGRPPRIG